MSNILNKLSETSIGGLSPEASMQWSATANAASGLVGGALSGGRSTGAGNVLQGLGSVASMIPGPYGQLASAGLNVVGGLVNKAFGVKWNKENIANIQQGIDKANSFKADVGSFDELSELAGNTSMLTGFTNKYIGSGGWFGGSGKVKRKANDLRAQQAAANDWMTRSIANNADQIEETQMRNLLASTYGFGGELETNGLDFTNGLIFINNGGTHEQNPNEGVLFGVDQEGTPNLVEEREVVYKDYVLSNRIKIPKKLAEKYKLTEGLTFAEASKKLSKESEERPNDVISKNGLDSFMNDLIEEQEMIKAKRNNNKYKNGGKVNKLANGTPNLFVPPVIAEDTNEFNDWENIIARRSPLIGPLTVKMPTKAPKIDITKSAAYKSPQTRARDLGLTPDISGGLANLRYMPAIGSAASVVSDLFGKTNKADYRNADLVLNTAREVGTPTQVKFSPIGNYLTNNPLDVNYYTNALNAQTGATRRALLNNAGANRGIAAASILAADTAAQNTLGNLFRQAQEYNAAQREKVATFNRGTNQYNSEGMLKAAIANQESRLKAGQMRLSGTQAAAQMRQIAKDSADAAKAANISNLLENIGNIGWEEYQRNAIMSNPALAGYYISRTGNLGYNNSRKKGGYLTIKKKK